MEDNLIKIIHQDAHKYRLRTYLKPVSVFLVFMTVVKTWFEIYGLLLARPHETPE